MRPADQAFLAVRDRVPLNAVQHVRLSFELDDEDAPNAKLVAVMRCAACDEGFLWQGGWWTCLSCGIELLPAEVTDLVAEAKEALKVLNTDVGAKRGFGRWHWVLRLLRLVAR